MPVRQISGVDFNSARLDPKNFPVFASMLAFALAASPELANRSKPLLLTTLYAADERVRFLHASEGDARPLGHPAFMPAPEGREYIAEPPFWFEGPIPLFDTRASGVETVRGQRRPIRTGVLYAYTRALGGRLCIAARFVVLVADEDGREPLPIAMPGTVLIDLGAYEGGSSLPIGDFIRAQHRIATANNASRNDLVHMDGYVTRRDQYVVRCSSKARDAIDIKPWAYGYAAFEWGLEPLRSMLSVTAVDIGDVFELEQGTDERKIAERLVTYVIARGPFLALSGLQAALYRTATRH